MLLQASPALPLPFPVLAMDRRPHPPVDDASRLLRHPHLHTHTHLHSDAHIGSNPHPHPHPHPRTFSAHPHPHPYLYPEHPYHPSYTPSYRTTQDQDQGQGVGQGHGQPEPHVQPIYAQPEILAHQAYPLQSDDRTYAPHPPDAFDDSPPPLHPHPSSHVYPDHARITELGAGAGAGAVSPPDHEQYQLGRSPDSDPHQLSDPSSPPSASRRKKDKRKLELSADQPFTTQGKPRQRVYVACAQCRSRKIRCDGAKPACHNCRKRAEEVSTPASGSGTGTGLATAAATASASASALDAAAYGLDCNYDALPKRRGPDRQPGARQRSARLPGENAGGGPVRRRRRRTDTSESVRSAENAHAPVDPVPALVLPEVLPLPPPPAPLVVPPRLHVEIPSTRSETQIGTGTSSIRTSATTPLDRLDMEYGPVSASSAWSASAVEPPTSATTVATTAYGASPLSTRHGYGAVFDEPIETLTPPMQHVSVPISGPSRRFTPPSYAPPPPPMAYEPALATAAGLTSARIVEIDDENEDGDGNGAYVHGQTQVLMPDVSSEPSLDFTRKTWWDALLALYASPDDDGMPVQHHHRSPSSASSSSSLVVLTGAQRDRATREITEDLRFLFRSSNYWFSFFHLPRFWNKFFEPEGRARLQPALVLAGLALATFLQSSEIGRGEAGRRKALRLREQAQGALEASINARWVDESLIMAAWLIGMFEIQPHPTIRIQRSLSAMQLLDSLIRSLSLTSLDTEPSYAAAGTLGATSQNSVPAVSAPYQAGSLPHPLRQLTPPSHSLHAQNALPPQTTPHHTPRRAPPIPIQDRLSPGLAYPPNALSSPPRRGCACADLTLGRHWQPAYEHTPLWVGTPAWNSNWTEAEMRKEECRRLCWSTAALAGGLASFSHAHQTKGFSLFITDPNNISLMFSGESLQPDGPGHVDGKNSIWALYDRLSLVWNNCQRRRVDGSQSDVDKAEFAIATWLETDAIEEALNQHTCDIEKTFVFFGREVLFNIRMCISYEYSRFIPLVSSDISGYFHRAKAEEWLRHLINTGTMLMRGLRNVTGQPRSQLTHRPYFVFWLMSQSARALNYWYCDNSLTLALDACKALLGPIDYLAALWPCAIQQQRGKTLRLRLIHACYLAGVSPPSSEPADLSYFLAVANAETVL